MSEIIDRAMSAAFDALGKYWVRDRDLANSEDPQEIDLRELVLAVADALDVHIPSDDTKGDASDLVRDVTPASTPLIEALKAYW